MHESCETTTQRSPVPDIPDWIGNVPGWVFTPDIWGTYTTASHQRLEYSNDLRSIHLTYPDTRTEANNYRQIRFYAKLVYNEDNERTVQFNVRSLLGDGSHHPDMRARELFNAAIQYFEYTHGPIQYIQGEWTDDDGLGHNHQQFYNALQSFGLKAYSDYTPDELAAAALATWTGEQAIANGFTKVIEVQRDDERNRIYPLFARPDLANATPA